MANRYVTAVSLDDQTGICVDSAQSRITGACIKTALAGNLTLNGVNNADGSAAAWTVTAGTSGYVAAPATGLCNRLTFSYANGADLGKATVIFNPL